MRHRGLLYFDVSGSASEHLYWWVSGSVSEHLYWSKLFWDFNCTHLADRKSSRHTWGSCPHYLFWELWETLDSVEASRITLTPKQKPISCGSSLHLSFSALSPPIHNAIHRNRVSFRSPAAGSRWLSTSRVAFYKRKAVQLLWLFRFYAFSPQVQWPKPIYLPHVTEIVTPLKLWIQHGIP